MSRTNTIARTLHDVGLAAWFGGSLMGAVGVNGAAADVDDPTQRARVANAGWTRWTPLNAAAIAAHLAGGAQLLRANKGRIVAQEGVARNSAIKAALTAAALGATAYSGLLGKKVVSAGDVPVAGGTDPLPSTPANVAQAQKQLKAMQWMIPTFTGSLLGMGAVHGEQQRPGQVLKGTVKSLPDRAAKAVKGGGKAAKGVKSIGKIGAPALAKGGKAYVKLKKAG